MLTSTLVSIRKTFPQGLLGMGSNWKFQVGGVILSLAIPLNKEIYYLNQKEGTDQVHGRPPSHTGKWFAMQYQLLPWRQNILYTMEFALVPSAPLKRGNLNTSKEEDGCRSPRKQPKKNNTSWNLQKWNFPLPMMTLGMQTSLSQPPFFFLDPISTNLDSHSLQRDVLQSFEAVCHTN